MLPLAPTPAIPTFPEATIPTVTFVVLETFSLATALLIIFPSDFITTLPFPSILAPEFSISPLEINTIFSPLIELPLEVFSLLSTEVYLVELPIEKSVNLFTFFSIPSFNVVFPSTSKTKSFPEFIALPFIPKFLAET